MRAPRIAFLFALLTACALGTFGLNATTLGAGAEETQSLPPTDPARQVAKLEEQIAELRKQRKSMARGTIPAAARLHLTKRSIEQGCCNLAAELKYDLDTLRVFHRKVEAITEIIRAAEDAFAKLHGVPPAGYLELTIRGEPEYRFVLKVRDVNGTKLGTTTVSGWSESTLTRVLLLMQAAPGMPKELRLVAQPTVIDTGVIPALKACAAAGYKNVTFTGFVATEDDSVKPGESPTTAGFKWYDEEPRNPAELAKAIESAPRRF